MSCTKENHVKDSAAALNHFPLLFWYISQHSMTLRMRSGLFLPCELGGKQGNMGTADRTNAISIHMSSLQQQGTKKCVVFFGCKIFVTELVTRMLLYPIPENKGV